jgi:hypothetical protein
MTAAQMIELMNRTPFEPLEIHLSDGTSIRVEHPYHIATRQDSPTCSVYDENNIVRFVAYRNITEVITAATTP